MKSSQIAAAVLAALATTVANGEEPKVACIPSSSYDGIQIEALCDASEFNKVKNLNLGENGCAIPGQQAEADNGDVYEQIPYAVWSDDVVKLPSCNDYQAASYWVEL